MKHERLKTEDKLELDLDILRNGKSHAQNVPSVLRRGIAKALRVGRVLGPDDGDGLGKSDVFKKNPFEDES